MANNLNFNVVANIRSAVSLIKGKGTKPLDAPELRDIQQYLGLDAKQSMLFIAIFDNCCVRRSADIDDIAKYFNSSVMDMLEMKKDFDVLLDKGLIIKEDDKTVEFTRTNFKIDSLVLECIIDNMPIDSKSHDCIKADQYEFVKMIGDFNESNRFSDKMPIRDKLRNLVNLEKKHRDIPFIADSLKLIDEAECRLMWYAVCNAARDRISRSRDIKELDLDEIITSTFDRISDIQRIKKSFISDAHPLQTDELLQVWADGDELKASLTDNGKRLFFQDDAGLYIKSFDHLDRYEFVKAVSDKIDDRKDTNRSTASLICSVEQLEQANADLQLVIQARQHINDLTNRVIFYEMCDDAMHRGTALDSTLDDIFHRAQEKMQHKTSFVSGSHPLQCEGLVDNIKEQIFGGAKLELTDLGREIFFGDDLALFNKQADEKNFINPDSIKEKNLFFSQSLDRQLSLLRDSLQEEQLIALTKRLEAQNLPQGVCALFYGLPGTGKTESVMQIARETGRQVMHVDISSTKSYWFGESEKLIKDVFNKYRRLCKRCKTKPILLFNEADAIFSKRKDTQTSSVAQTENAIQNIILEEMERLDGILIATTNLADNLDAAFERRFLFKIRFDKPTLEAKIRIWQDKLTTLSTAEAQRLAADFDFSGGQIDNIVKKSIMMQVVNGDEPSLDSIIRLCGEEKIMSNCIKLGFR